MPRTGRAEPLPQAMQGRWVVEDEPESEMTIDGGEIVCFGHRVDYDTKLIEEIDGALTVTLEIADSSAEAQDSFSRANITGLVIDPDGNFHGFSVKFAATFVRPAA